MRQPRLSENNAISLRNLNLLNDEDHLLAWQNWNHGVSAKTICESVKEDMDAFVSNEEQFDDIIMLCLTWYGPQEGDADA